MVNGIKVCSRYSKRRLVQEEQKTIKPSNEIKPSEPEKPKKTLGVLKFLSKYVF